MTNTPEDGLMTGTPMRLGSVGCRDSEATSSGLLVVDDTAGSPLSLPDELTSLSRLTSAMERSGCAVTREPISRKRYIRRRMQHKYNSTRKSDTDNKHTLGRAPVW